jgi:alkylglycerol monooxygenase
MALNPIVLAVPFYFIGMGVEAAIDRKLRAGLYTVDDTLNNLACGLYQQLLTVVAATALMAPYYWIYQHARLTHWFDAHPVISWVAAFVLSDFFYYWFHRWSHESAIGWFSHVVHHQSEEYNLSVALRQDAWQPLFSMWFYLPLALLGLAPATFATAYGLVIVYQYWIHTRLIGEWDRWSGCSTPRRTTGCTTESTPSTSTRTTRASSSSGTAVRHFRARGASRPPTAPSSPSRAGTPRGPTSPTG